MPKQTPNTRKAAKSTSKAGEANAAAKQQKETETKETAKPVSQEEEESDPEPTTKPTSSTKTKPSKEHENAKHSDRNDDPDTPPAQEDQQEADMSDLELDEEGTAFITSHWDGVLPIAEGIVSKHFKRNSITEQCRQAEALLEVLESGDGAKVQLDQTNWTPFLLAVPGSFRKVKVVYGVTSYAPPADEAGQNRKPYILALSGEYTPEISFPKVMLLPERALKPSPVYFPIGEAFSSKRKDHRITTATWFTNVKTTRFLDLPFLIPVPPVLVYDSFDKDVDAMIIYERWMYIKQEADETFDTLDKTLRKFLKGQVVAATAKKPQGRLNMEVFLEEAPPSFNEWKKEQLKVFSLASEKTRNSKAAPSSAHECTSGPEPSHTSFAREVASVMAEANHSYFQKMHSTKDRPAVAIETTNKHLGLAKSSFELIIIYCGLVAGEEDSIPSIWYQLAEDRLSPADKRGKARRWMETHVRYRDCKPKLHQGFLKMITKREFEDDVSSCLKTAIKGLTPFAVPVLSDDEVNRINEHERALETAKLTTVKDVKEPLLSVVIPSDIYGLTRNLKRFANVCYAMFGKDCKLFLFLEDMIDDLLEYSDTAIASVSKRTIASILWAVHVQARYFSAGHMGPDAKYPLLAPFEHMLYCIKNFQPVINGDVPPALYVTKPNSTAMGISEGQGIKRKNRGNNTPTEPSKRVKIVDNPNYHPYIKQRMQRFRVPGQKLPRVGQLCAKSGCVTGDLFPGSRNQNLCVKATLYGTCFESCERDHLRVTDEEAKSAMAKLQTVITNPNLVLQVNN